MRYNKAPFSWEPLLCQGPTLSWFTSWLVWGKAAPLHHISLGRSAHTPFIALPFWHYRALKISARFSCKDNNRIDRNNHPVEKRLNESRYVKIINRSLLKISRILTFWECFVILPDLTVLFDDLKFGVGHPMDRGFFPCRRESLLFCSPQLAGVLSGTNHCFHGNKAEHWTSYNAEVKNEWS
jgi:hypothetical protein